MRRGTVCCTQLVNKVVPLLSVSRLLGHSNTKMTERYAHVDLEKLKFDMKNLSLKGETVTRSKNRFVSLMIAIRKNEADGNRTRNIQIDSLVL